MRTRFTVSGDIATFDAAAFRAALYLQFPEAKDIRLAVSPGSVQVAVTMTMSSEDAADSAAATIASTPTTDMQSRWFGGLNLQIERASVPIVESISIAAPSPPPPLLPQPSLPSLPNGSTTSALAGGGSSVEAATDWVAVAVVAASGGLLALALLLALHCFWRARQKPPSRAAPEVQLAKRDTEEGDFEADEEEACEEGEEDTAQAAHAVNASAFSPAAYYAQQLEAELPRAKPILWIDGGVHMAGSGGVDLLAAAAAAHVISTPGAGRRTVGEAALERAHRTKTPAAQPKPRTPVTTSYYL